MSPIMTIFTLLLLTLLINDATLNSPNRDPSLTLRSSLWEPRSENPLEENAEIMESRMGENPLEENEAIMESRMGICYLINEYRDLRKICSCDSWICKPCFNQILDNKNEYKCPYCRAEFTYKNGIRTKMIPNRCKNCNQRVGDTPIGDCGDLFCLVCVNQFNSRSEGYQCPKCYKYYYQGNSFNYDEGPSKTNVGILMYILNDAHYKVGVDVEKVSHYLTENEDLIRNDPQFRTYIRETMGYDCENEVDEIADFISTNSPSRLNAQTYQEFFSSSMPPYHSFSYWCRVINAIVYYSRQS